MNELMAVVDRLANGEIVQMAGAAQKFLQQNMGVSIAGVVLGLLICFLGLKLIRVLAALAGFLAGGILGIVVSQMLGLQEMPFLVVTLVAAVIVAVLSAALYRFGVFLWVCYLGISTGLLLMDSDSIVLMIVCIGAGLLLAILASIFLDPLIIIVSALTGGFLAGASIAGLAGFEDHFLITCVIGAALAILGLAVQFLMKSREVGRKEKRYSEEFKEKESMETEVEKARMLLDDEENLEEVKIEEIKTEEMEIKE